MVIQYYYKLIFLQSLVESTGQISSLPIELN